jgi:undecaprenyl-diphosphatase
MMRRLTHLGGARATLGAGLVLLVADDARVGTAVLLANAASHLVVQALKRLVGRARPCDTAGTSLALVDLPDPFSFPSGHSAAVTAVAATLALAHPPAGLVALPIAVAVCASRVQLRVHHVSDVLAGALLGLGGAILATRLVF